MVELSDARRHQLVTFLQNLSGDIPTGRVDFHLLDLALIHPSLNSKQNNDRLEFLGDAVLRLLVGEFLYATYPRLTVGQLALLRSDLLSNSFFAQLAGRFDFESVLQLGGSAFKDEKGKDKRHADAFEAVVGALYLGFQASESTAGLQQPSGAMLRSWLQPLLKLRADTLLNNLQRHNAKTALQELTQRQWGKLPNYRVQQQDTAGAHQFNAEVWLESQYLGKGQGHSKKAAETEAAIAALKTLQSSNPT